MMLIWANIKAGASNFKIVTGGTAVKNGPCTGCGSNFFEKELQQFGRKLKDFKKLLF